MRTLMQQDIIAKLRSYVDAAFPIIYIHHFDFNAVDALIKQIKNKALCLEFNNADGQVEFDTKCPLEEEASYTVFDFLKNHMDDGLDDPTFIILKDIQESFKDNRVIAQLRKISEHIMNSPDYQCTVFIVSSELEIPKALEHYITICEIPLPSYENIKALISDFAQEVKLNLTPALISELATACKGMNEVQIKKTLKLAYQEKHTLNSHNKHLILSEKEQLIKKSSILEMVKVDNSCNLIGLDKLDSWLEKKGFTFKHLDEAFAFGLKEKPKGILLVGIPGCGKSQAAKAAAQKFGVPLVKMDLGRIFGKYVGESERNMRTSLQLAESIAPCILWIDEIEKAFTGLGSDDGGSTITTRLFGNFLTWMQEKEQPVFIIATANNITNLPPELMRKGRFDELFFIDLPNEEARAIMLLTLLMESDKYHESDIDIDKLVQATQNFSGAELVSLVQDTIETAFLERKATITTNDMMATIKETKLLSLTLKDKIDKMRKELKEYHFKSAC